MPKTTTRNRVGIVAFLTMVLESGCATIEHCTDTEQHVLHMTTMAWKQNSIKNSSTWTITVHNPTDDKVSMLLDCEFGLIEPVELGPHQHTSLLGSAMEFGPFKYASYQCELRPYDPEPVSSRNYTVAYKLGEGPTVSW
jgi:uncharacterized protein YceK